MTRATTTKPLLATDWIPFDRYSGGRFQRFRVEFWRNKGGWRMCTHWKGAEEVIHTSKHSTQRAATTDLWQTLGPYFQPNTRASLMVAIRRKLQERIG